MEEEEGLSSTREVSGLRTASPQMENSLGLLSFDDFGVLRETLSAILPLEEHLSQLKTQLMERPDFVIEDFFDMVDRGRDTA